MKNNYDKCFGCIYISQKYLGLSRFQKLGKIIAIFGEKIIFNFMNFFVEQLNLNIGVY